MKREGSERSVRKVTSSWLSWILGKVMSFCRGRGKIEECVSVCVCVCVCVRVRARVCVCVHACVCTCRYCSSSLILFWTKMESMFLSGLLEGNCM